jgi:hypothetical protein
MIVELPPIEKLMLSRDKLKQKFNKILSLDAHPGHIAVGFAVGVFISFTPFFGLHTPLAIAFAFLFRLNKLTCITGAWVNTPLTIVPVLVASYNLGRFLRGKPTRDLVFKGLEWHQIQPYAKSILLGSSIIGFVAAVAAYFICYWLVVALRKRDLALAEITREMEDVGEELD